MNIKTYSFIITLLFLGAIAFIAYEKTRKQIEQPAPSLPKEVQELTNLADSAFKVADRLSIENDSLKSIKHEKSRIQKSQANSISYISNDSNTKLLTTILPHFHEVVERHIRDTN